MRKLKGWKDIPTGTAITEAGSSVDYLTGGWRDNRPEHNKDKCTNCLFCWVYCPEGAIIVKDDQVTGINYDYCKGCGICAAECPPKVKAITMVKEPKLM
ncbi:MAG: 4Fe-4S binding protein [Peptococcaceae bacterium]